MEHRWGKRSGLNIGARLCLSSGAVAAGRIANASLSGAFVRTANRIPVLTRVLVELDTNSAGQNARECIPAYIVRATQDGVGLEWNEFTPPAIAALLARFATARPRCVGMRSAGKDLGCYG
jgi:PilZ domain